MARWLMVVVAACSTPAQPTPVSEPTPPPRAISHAARLAPDAGVLPDAAAAAHAHGVIGESQLARLQASLGAAATTCAGTATLLADQGTTTEAKLRWRERTVLRLCREDTWPERVRECVATADHDQLSCTAYLETPRQQTRWDAAFERWLE